MFPVGPPRPGAALTAPAVSPLSRGADPASVLRQAGLKLTPQRLAIVRALADDPTHPSAQELFERLRTSLPTMSFATVYNTLAALAEAGLCAARSFSTRRSASHRAAARGVTRFDPNVVPHDHAVCDACGAVSDVALDGVAADRGPGRQPGANPRSAAAPSPSAAGPGRGGVGLGGFDVRSVERIYRGVCPACQAARAELGGAAPRRTDSPRSRTQPRA